MNTDPQTPKKKYNLRKRKKNQKKMILDSDSESDSDDSDYTPHESDDEDEEFQLRNWQRFLEKCFPSKYTNKRNKMLQAIDALKKNSNEVMEIETDSDENNDIDKEEETDEESDRDEDDIFELFEGDELLNNSNMKVNIIFTVGENYEEEEEDEDEDEKDEDEEPEEDEIVVDIKSNPTKTKKIPKSNHFEIDEQVEVKLDKWEDWKKGIILKKKEKKDGIFYNVKVNSYSYSNIHQDKIRRRNTVEDNIELLNELKELMTIKKNKGKNAMNKKLEKMIHLQEQEIIKKQKKNEKKTKINNNKLFKKLLHSPNLMCDLKYFRTLSVSKQKIILEQMKEIKKHSQLKKPYRMTLLETKIPMQYKVTAFNKINTLTQMDPAGGEYYKIKQWVDTFMHIPFGKYNSLPVTITEGKEKCQHFMENAREVLDKAAFGLNDAKMQIMQMVGQWISNPHSVGTAIAIHGPMGTGKTTLVKEGISKILNRPFAFIALGGATDSSFLEGHSYTYEGSTWGKIVDILIQSKCMNPIIYFDELDKVSETPKGEEIIGILTHLTDNTQNLQFHDKYFSNIDFDLSKALFIFSYNDEKKINNILKDRMYRIETKGYTKAEKTTIAIEYLIPVIEKNINFEKGQITVCADAIHYIIDNYTQQEKGVRNLKRCLEIMYTKLNLFRLMKPDSKLFDTKMISLKVDFPYKITVDVLDKLLVKNSSEIPYGLYI